MSPEYPMKNSIHDLSVGHTLRVELKGIRSKKALFEALASGLKLPRHFGHNWDALSDCLMDASWAKQPSYSVLILDSAAAATRFGSEWDTLLEVFEDACDWWNEHDKTFHVVLT